MIKRLLIWLASLIPDEGYTIHFSHKPEIIEDEKYLVIIKTTSE